MYSYIEKLELFYKKHALYINVGLVVFLLLSGYGVKNFLSKDYLEKYRLGLDKTDDSEFSVHLYDINFRQYDGKDITAEALLTDMHVTKDRSLIKFGTIVDGIFHGKKKEVHFSGKNGEWHAKSERLYAREDSRIFNKDIDIKTSYFEFDRPSSMLYLPYEFGGRMYDGTVDASNLKYNIDDDSFTMSAATWVGPLESLEKAMDGDEEKEKDEKTVNRKSENSEGNSVGKSTASNYSIELLKRLADRRYMVSGLACRSNQLPRVSNASHYTVKKDAPKTSKVEVKKLPGSAVGDNNNSRGKSDNKRQKWKIKADAVSRLPGSSIEIWHRAIATDDEVTLFADRLERDVETEVMTATGSVKYIDEELVVLCKKATILRNDKRAILEDDVQIYIKADKEKGGEEVNDDDVAPLKPILPEDITKLHPQGSQEEREKELDDEVQSKDSMRKYPIIVWTKKIDYYYEEGKRKGIITGGITARQELQEERWRTLWAHSGILDREQDKMKLLSTPGKVDVTMKTSLGDDLRAKWIELSTVKDDDSWSAEGIVGEMYIHSDDIPKLKDK